MHNNQISANPYTVTITVCLGDFIRYAHSLKYNNLTACMYMCEECECMHLGKIVALHPELLGVTIAAFREGETYAGESRSTH